MKGVLEARGATDGRAFVADSFEGLPAPDASRYPSDRGSRLHREEFLAISEETVRANLEKSGLLDERVVFLKGWFRDTLPRAAVERLSILRLDGDLYESTMDGLTHLYPKLSKGGFCIIDDHALRMCRRAVEDYRREHGIEDPLEAVDWICRWGRKT